MERKLFVAAGTTADPELLLVTFPPASSAPEFILFQGCNIVFGNMLSSLLVTSPW